MICPICLEYSKLLGSIAFDRNNAGVPVINTSLIDYYKCSSCYFVYCPEMLSWTPDILGDIVYNEDYIKYDPDYTDVRPKNYAVFFRDTFNGRTPGRVRHLDYGSGSGIMSDQLIKYGWNSDSYDPYVSTFKPIGRYDFVTAIEVFEHSLDIDTTIKDIKSYLTPKGVIVFSTQLATKDTTIDWWYIGARNGHIGILSKESLKILAIRNNLYFSSLNDGIHILQPNKNNLRDMLGVMNGRPKS
jgi:hypothetical protein